MALITDPAAILHSNEWVRPLSNILWAAYKRANNVSTQWTALGGGQVALDTLRSQIKDGAIAILDATSFAWQQRRVWNGISSPTR